MNPTHLPYRTKCSHSCETVQHILLECPGLHKARQELLPPHLSVHNTLYTSLPQLQNTCRFYNLALAAHE
uniref:Reverse transcriptase zinc-binding domain-containing protein n=1 Tax=Arion vulgaris TaxID=1028688 RepID=A0A0B7BS51_9EUPU